LPVPLVELHTHLEGAITPTRLRVLADKYGQAELARACLTADGQDYAFTGFAGFLELFKHVSWLLRSPADYHAVALDLAARLDAEGIVYAEVMVAYGVMQKRGIDPLPVQAALAEAAAAAQERGGVVMRWLPDAVRQFGVDAARRALEVALQAGRELGVVGCGLGGDEAAAPPQPFAALFADVAAAGLGVTIHAGETAGPDSVRAAVQECGATRVGHGIAAVRDPAVMDLLHRERVWVELCPGSNLRTGVVQRPEAHPWRRFVDADIPCNLNTDDRAIFQLDLPGEYAWAAAHGGLTRQEILTMQWAALDASFCAAEERRRLAGRLAANPA
jgi:adenosine deaminase